MPKTQKESKTTVETKSDLLESIFDRMSTAYHIPAKQITSVLRETAFKDDKTASDSEMVSLLSVADKYKLDPFIREIYAFRNKKGVLTNIIGVDGWIKIMNTQPTFKGADFVYSDEMTTIGKSKKCHEWIEIHIYDEKRDRPIVIREYLDECYNGGNFDRSPWNTHTKRFLRHKAISQGVRVAYGVNEGYDPDEAERIDQAIEAEEIPEAQAPETAAEIPTEAETVEEAPQEKPATDPAPETDNLAEKAAKAGEPAERGPETEKEETEPEQKPEPTPPAPEPKPEPEPKPKKKVVSFF